MNQDLGKTTTRPVHRPPDPIDNKLPTLLVPQEAHNIVIKEAGPYIPPSIYGPSPTEVSKEKEITKSQSGSRKWTRRPRSCSVGGNQSAKAPPVLYSGRREREEHSKAPILQVSAAIWIQIRDSLYLLVKQFDFVDLGFRISDCGSIDHDLERFRVQLQGFE
ncbi:hypothetical protein LWI29_025241 [Acer saccharum]|uniref:Uncharacterized protein n=1 Tax=Acer saccharum TaxID=4024 RepID=A0AA39REY2_ACESA|nr:hypothetical protein LWI29_025241 [Acer saccharum]